MNILDHYESFLADPGAVRRAEQFNGAKIMKTKVGKFWLQPTASFEDGAPQREEFLSERFFSIACGIYEAEWREKYQHDGQCRDRNCPQCFPSNKL